MAHELAAALHRGLAVEHERLNVAARDVLFLVCEVLEADEHALELFIAQFIAHGFELFAQRVLAGVLTEHHRVLRDADVRGVHDLVGPRVGDDAVLVDARLVREGVCADDGLARRDGDARDVAQQLARTVDLLGVHAGLGVVEVLSRA